MKKRSRTRKPKRTQPRRRRQERQQLGQQVQELYPPPGQPRDEATPWEDAFAEPRLPLPARGDRRRPAAAVEVPPDSTSAEVPPDSAAVPPDSAADTPADLRGRVVELASGLCWVVSDGRELECALPSRLARDQQRQIAVGDEVLVSTLASGDRRVEQVLPRRTSLARPDPQNPRRERVIAANVDTVVQVVAVVKPPLRPALIDRCFIVVERGGAELLICVNKIDLLPDPEERQRELARLAPYRDLGLRVLPCSARTGEGVAELHRELAGRTAVFFGHSGVGKSSLLNALDPTVDARTGEVSGTFGKGRHTTTRATLHQIAGDVALIDTPGIRELGLFDLTADELPVYFPELLPHAAACRFNDCSHRQEPGCAVREAAAAGDVDPARYATYLRILASLAD